MYAGRVIESSDPIGAGSGDPTAESVFAHRSREGAVLDRFLAVRTGFEQRRAESALSEDGGDEDHIFAFLQVSLAPSLTRVRPGHLPRAPLGGRSGGGSLRETIVRANAQPAARIEDLLLNLSPRLVSPSAHAALAHAFPLPHTHVSVGLSSRWVQIYLHSSPVGGRSTGRTLVAELKRQPTAEATVERIGAVLEAIRAGHIPWGSTRIE